jgi:hypothetical protein
MKMNYVLLQDTYNLMVFPFPEEPIMRNTLISKASVLLIFEQTWYVHFIQFLLLHTIFL